MPISLDRQQSRDVDRRAVEEFGLSGLVLMENAGRGVADRLIELGAQGPVLIACGRGNNGGDGFVIARHLDAAGIDVRVAVWGTRAEYRGDAAVNLEIILRSSLRLEFCDGTAPDSQWWAQQAECDWVVDALLGTGARGAPRAPFDEAIRRINAMGKPILAVDLPSGLDCDTGVSNEPTIRATETCTFVAEKPGFFVPSAQPYVGHLTVLPIGVPRALLDELGITPLRK